MSRYKTISLECGIISNSPIINENELPIYTETLFNEEIGSQRDLKTVLSINSKVYAHTDINKLIQKQSGTKLDFIIYELLHHDKRN